MANDKVVVIPKNVIPHSTVKSVVGIVLTFVMYYGAIALIVWALSLPLWGAIPLVLIGCVIGGYGMLDMGFMGHDGFHFSLSENRVVSASMGLFANLPIFFPATGFAVSHWNHHKHTNGSDDPDVQIFGKFKTFWSRVLFARPYAIVAYMKNTVLLASGKPLGYTYTFPLPYAQMQLFARLNLLGSLVFFLATMAVLFQFPVFAIPFALVFASGLMISGLSPYVEHTNTLFGRGKDTRTSTGWWRDIFLMQNNYHIEHHLYPTIPAYNLKRAHEYLKSVGYYDTKRFTTHGYVAALKTTFSDHEYPNFGSGK